MTNTFVKGRYAKDKRRGFKREGLHHKCHCRCCRIYQDRKKGLKKTKERNEINMIIEEYNSIKNQLYKNRTIRWLIPMTE